MTGIGPDERLDTRSRATMVPLVAAMSYVENGVAAVRGQVERGFDLAAE